MRVRVAWRALVGRIKSLAACHEPAAESRVAMTGRQSMLCRFRWWPEGSAGRGAGTTNWLIEVGVPGNSEAAFKMLVRAAVDRNNFLD